MTSTQTVPEGLADMPPGPELAAALAKVDRSRVSGSDSVVLLAASYRLKSYVDAEFLSNLAEVAIRNDATGLGRDEEPGEFASDEARIALALTRSAATARTDLAWDLTSRLSQVLGALRAGHIDEPKARVFSDWTLDLTDEQARMIATELLPEAGELTTGQLIDRIKKCAIALDPDWALRRFHRAVGERRVIGYPNPDGTANLSGLSLPTDRVVTVCARLDRLARAARNAGHHGTLDHLRADLLLGMTDGSFTSLTDTEILAALLTQGSPSHPGDAVPRANTTGTTSTAHAKTVPEPKVASPAGKTVGSTVTRTSQSALPSASGLEARTRNAHDTSGCGEPSPPGSHDVQGTNEQDNRELTTREPGNREQGAREQSSREHELHGPDTREQSLRERSARRHDAREDSARERSAREPGDDEHSAREDSARDRFGRERINADPASPDRPRPEAEPKLPGPSPARPGLGIELRVALSTLLGLDRRPAELAGWGPIPAEIARELASANGGGEWRFAIHDDDGHLLHAGITRHRPAGLSRSPSEAIVELHVSAGLLTTLTATPDQARAWEKLSIDLAVQYAEASVGEPLDPAGTGARRRFADAGLRRFIEIRDRTCSFPPCRAPARRADLDHSFDYANGGLTVAGNLGPACRHDHRLKDQGWQLSQPAPGHFRWRSRLGHTYDTPPKRIAEPLPAPLPGADLPSPQGTYQEGLPASWPPTSVKPAPPPRKPPGPDEPPPF